MKISKIYFSFLIMLILYSCAATSSNISSNEFVEVWPEEAWVKSTPESQGINSLILLDLLKEMNLPESGINSMVITRNGYIIAEYYRKPYSALTTHRINSCTKSFTSALVGIALDEKLIDNVNQPISFYFDEVEEINPEASEITIKNLLTMQSGFQWNSSVSYSDPNADGRLHQLAENQRNYLFSKPIINVPGTAFQYNSMNSQLLADIINQVTEIEPGLYAKEKLFDPLGINTWGWEKTYDNNLTGGTDLVMSTEDLARFGYLYLHEGEWNGNRIISKEWVSESISPQTSTDEKSPAPYYGYHWWIGTKNIFLAVGGGGQYCYVNKNNSIVLAVNSDMNESQLMDVFNPMIIGFSTLNVADSPLPENEESFAKLQDYLALSSQDTNECTYHSQNLLEQKISDKLIQFDENEYGFLSLQYTFTDDNNIVLNIKYIDSNGNLITGNNYFNIGKEYCRKKAYVPQEDFYGRNDYEHYGRVTHISENSMRYEMFDTGSEKTWYTDEIEIENNDVIFTRHIHEFGNNREIFKNGCGHFVE